MTEVPSILVQVSVLINCLNLAIDPKEERKASMQLYDRTLTVFSFRKEVVRKRGFRKIRKPWNIKIFSIAKIIPISHTPSQSYDGMFVKQESWDWYNKLRFERPSSLRN